VESDWRKRFGEAILRLREFLQLTQKQMADRLGLSGADTVLRLENGQAGMIAIGGLGELAAILRANGMTFEQFLTGERPPVLGTAEELMQALASMIVQERQRWEREKLDVQPTHRPLTPSEWVVLQWLRKIDEQTEGKA